MVAPRSRAPRARAGCAGDGRVQRSINRGVGGRWRGARDGVVAREDRGGGTPLGRGARRPRTHRVRGIDVERQRAEVLHDDQAARRRGHHRGGVDRRGCGPRLGGIEGEAGKRDVVGPAAVFDRTGDPPDVEAERQRPRPLCASIATPCAPPRRNDTTTACGVTLGAAQAFVGAVLAHECETTAVVSRTARGDGLGFLLRAHDRGARHDLSLGGMTNTTVTTATSS